MTKQPWKAVILAVALAAPARAAELTSNGTGGGPWSDPASWKGNVAPQAADEVTIRKGDAIVFDQNDDMKITCAKLFLDPQGVLRFKTGAGKIVFVSPGPIESFGLIKLDGTASADDFHELRFVGKSLATRTLKSEKGGGLIAVGKKLPGGKMNVTIVARDAKPNPNEVPATVEIKGGTLDVQRVELFDVRLMGTEIDNTGAKPGQRCQILNNRFRKRSTVYLTSADTPLVNDNDFDYDGGPWIQPGAIGLNGATLAEIKNNTIKGMYYYGINAYGAYDSIFQGNSIEKTCNGIYTVGNDCMYRQNTFKGLSCGFVVTSMTGTMEGCVFEKCNCGVHLAGATIQMSDIAFNDPPKDGRAVDFSAGEITLINCNFGPTSFTFVAGRAKSDKTLVTSLHYLVLGVKGEVPEDAVVDVRSANGPPLAPGVSDLNVRNAPAPIQDGRTPLPQSLSPILLRTWTIDKDGKTIPAPDYTVRVLGPTDGVKERAVLKTLTVKPDEKWYRARPNDAAPTVEVPLR